MIVREEDAYKLSLKESLYEFVKLVIVLSVIFAFMWTGFKISEITGW